MPKGTVEEAKDFSLEEDTPYRAQLLEVVEKTTPGGVSKKTGKEYDSFTNWIWKFEVTEGPQLGEWCWAKTDSVITTADHDRVRTLGRALRQKDYELGEGIDTDDLIGLECYIEVANESYTKADGTTGFMCPVINAYALVDTGSVMASGPAAGGDPWATGQDEPPF